VSSRAQDVADRLTGHDLERLRLRYDDLLQASSHAYVITDTRGKILAVNAAAAHLLDPRDGHLEGRLLSLFVDDDDRGPLRELAREAVAGAPAERVLRLGRPGQAASKARVEVAALGGADAVELRWLFRDLEGILPLDAEAELKRRVAAATARLEQATRVAELERTRLRHVLERFPHGVIVVDRKLHVVFANPGARRLLAPQRIKPGLPLPDPWTSYSLREHARTLFGPRPTLGERAVHTPDGRELVLRSYPARLGGDAIVVVEDITARTRRDRAERDFLANAAHELRTPVTAIANALEVLQGGADDSPEDRQRFMAHARRETERMARLVSTLLTLARAEGAAEPPRLEPIEVEPLVREVVERLEPSEGVVLVVDVAPDVQVLSDPDLLRQALLNVVANAVEHTREGEIRLSATGARGHVDLVVSDTGQGIPAEYRDRVFERFFRGGDRSRPGFGLGLSIAARAVHVLGGEVSLESEVSRGATVVMRLPAAGAVLSR
jgi:signal transduction histidine kinase